MEIFTKTLKFDTTLRSDQIKLFNKYCYGIRPIRHFHMDLEKVISNLRKNS
jgi:hypothetical protein